MKLWSAVLSLAPNFCLAFILAFSAGVARAESPPAPATSEVMQCIVSVATASDAISADAVQKNAQIVSMPLVDGSADLEVQIAGETVALSLWKYEHTDLYNFAALLVTPKADLPPRGPPAVAIVTDFLYNDGPTQESGWDLNPGVKATRFAYLNRPNGSFGVSTKLLSALKAAGKWGTHPFNSMQMDITNSPLIADFIRDQLAAKTMKPTDVIGISTAFSCSLQR